MACPPGVEVPGVVRVPILNASPYTTLVCCTFYGSDQIAAPVLTRWRKTLTSAFRPSNFSQTAAAPMFKHSTSAWISHMGPAGGRETWLYSIDDVPNAGFNADGLFFVELDLAVRWTATPRKVDDQPIFGVWACSYVLVDEGPPGWPGGRPKPVPYGGTPAPPPRWNETTHRPGEGETEQ